MKLSNIFKKRETVRKIHFEFWLEPDDDVDCSDKEFAEKYGKHLASRIGLDTEHIRKKGTGLKWTCRTEHYYK